MSYFVYVLKSKQDSSFYIGISKNPEYRLKEHNFGDSKYTKGHRPYELIYKEEFQNRLLARDREKYLKSGSGRDFLKSLFPRSSVGRASGCARAKRAQNSIRSMKKGGDIGKARYTYIRRTPSISNSCCSQET